MDKQTLSHYGWIIVMVLTLSVMLAFATPLGQYIGRGVSNFAIAMGIINDGAVEEDNIEKLGDEWDDYLNAKPIELNTHGFAYGEFYVMTINDGEHDYLTGFTLTEDGKIIFGSSYYGTDCVSINENAITAGFDIESDLFFCGSDTYTVNGDGTVAVLGATMTFKNNGRTAIVAAGGNSAEYNLIKNGKSYVPFDYGEVYKYVTDDYMETLVINSDLTGEHYSSDYGTAPVTSVTFRGTGFTIVNMDAPVGWAPSMMYIMYTITDHFYCGVVG